MHDDHRPGRELDDTAGSAADDRLDELISQIKARGGVIKKDETSPLEIEFNRDFVDIGEERIVEFSRDRTDFQLIRTTKSARVVGGQKRAHLEGVSRPIVEMKLKSKPDTSEQWVVVDFDEMF